jgi:hypothetical protein
MPGRETLRCADAEGRCFPAHGYALDRQPYAAGSTLHPGHLPPKHECAELPLLLQGPLMGARQPLQCSVLREQTAVQRGCR